MLLRDRVYNILEITPAGGLAGSVFGVFIAALILLNVAAVVLATDEPLYLAFQPVFDLFEVFSVAVFSVECLLRLWTAPCNPASGVSAGGHALPPRRWR